MLPADGRIVPGVAACGFCQGSYAGANGMMRKKVIEASDMSK
jgi:hypothetical protein